MLILYNLHQIVQIVDDEEMECLRGDAMNSIKIIECENSSLAIFCDISGKIGALGTYQELIKKLESLYIDVSIIKHVDCKGGSVIPGLVDGHTHPVFAGDRVHEFAMKLAGATYMEVQKAGGGIHFTTQKTREASEDQLLKDFEVIAKEMLKSGTTLLEAKSGYGLDMETEIKQLQVLQSASKRLPLEISGTFCGAHAVPKGSTEEAQTKLIIETILPEIEHMQKSGELTVVENIDVFCEKGVFELESSQKILEAGKNIGLRANFHADELHPLGGAEMGAKFGGRDIKELTF
uniref:Imidazolonepropionase n=1 Tax=Acrobeloides nanus TaxID=290746 RepID=A0A914DG42_9BILA